MHESIRLDVEIDFSQVKIDSKNIEPGDVDFTHLLEMYLITITNFDIRDSDYMLYTLKNACKVVHENIL